MCLILIAWQVHPEFPLVVAANRDEFFARATAAATFWPEHPDVLAGRDQEAGGTWLGVTRHGRFAALTNYRDGKPQKTAPSRGALVADFLSSHANPDDYLSSIQPRAESHNGFNLLVGDAERLGYLSNRTPEGTPIRWLEPGIYGLSNHLLDTPWLKLLNAKSSFTGALDRLPDTSAMFDLLLDDELAPDHQLPETGVSFSREKSLSAIFVKTPDYGTRAGTVITRHSSGSVTFTERAFGRNAEPLGEVYKTFQSSRISTDV